MMCGTSNIYSNHLPNARVFVLFEPLRQIFSHVLRSGSNFISRRIQQNTFHMRATMYQPVCLAFDSC